MQNFNPLIGFDVLRPDEGGNLHGSQFAGLGGMNRRYNLADINALQGGDTIYARHGMNPVAPDGANGFWTVSGHHPGVGANPGADAYEPGQDMTQWRWVENPQAPAPQQEAPQEPGPQQELPARLPIYDNSPGGWDQYMDFARAETEGLNRMPFVYGVGPQTGTRFLTDDPAQQFNTFFPPNLQGWQEYLRNPMFEADAPPAAIGNTGTSAARSRNPWDFGDTNWTNPIFR